MEMKISDKIFEKWPELEVGILIVRNADNKSNEKELLDDIIDEIKKKVSLENILEIPSIAKWREAHKEFGSKPKKKMPSVEALLRQALTRGVGSINCLVDLYNYVSLKYKMTVGGEDIDQIKGDVVLDFAKGDEEFYTIGSDANEPPKEGEVVYKDEQGVICRRWNWREADRTKLTSETKDAVLVIENLIPEEHDKFLEALNELKELIMKKCKAECNIEVLNKDNLEVQI
jgi:DNA/RNA-binding domain of Phe-tRNA-synthetase-like protein